MRNRLPIVYLVDSAGVNLPYQDGIFPGQYGAGRIFLLQLADAPQAAHPADRRRDGAVHRGRRVSAGAQRLHHHGGGHQFHGARRSEPGEGRHRPGDRFRTARRRAHAHFRQRRGALHGEGRCRLPRAHPRAFPPVARRRGRAPTGATPPARDASQLYGVLPADHRLPYEIEDVIFRIFDSADYREFQPEYAPEMLCADARLDGRPVAVIANRRGFLKAQGGPRIGGIIYAESARKVAYFVETAERLGTPLVYLQDVSGFMVGPEAEREGIIRAGAEMVETMTLRHRSQDRAHAQPRQRRGLLRHGGPGLRPQLHIQLAHRAHRRHGGRIGRGQALYSAELEKHKGGPLPEELREPGGAHPRPITSAGWTRATPPRAATATPSSTRSKPAACLSFALEASMQHATPAPKPGATHDPHRQRPGLLGRLAGSAGPPGGAGADRLSGARLSGRGHHVDPAEAEAGRPEPRLRARFSAADRAHRARRSASAASR